MHSHGFAGCVECFFNLAFDNALTLNLQDRKGIDSIRREELLGYAEEDSDVAQEDEIRTVLDALDADGDGCVGMLDFVLFAARMKEHALHVNFHLVMAEVRSRRRC